MEAAVSDLKQEWRRFKADRPGERFENHRRRMAKHPRWHHIVRAALGFMLVALGIAFCFLPGPGLLGIVFGVALLAGMSRALATRMDRIEPRARAAGARLAATWRGLSRATRTAIVVVATAVVAIGLVAGWRWAAAHLA